MFRLGILGCGNMGAAICRAITKSLPDMAITLFDTDVERSIALAAETSSVVASSFEEFISSTDCTLLAVKPQILSDLFPLLAEGHPDRSYISIAAGVSLKTLSVGLSSHDIVRFMPNIAASVESAVTAVAPDPACDKRLVDIALSIASACGTYHILPESSFNAFTGISGSAIAFYFRFVHAIAMGGTLEGIPYDTACAIANETFAGASRLLDVSGTHPEALLSSVTSAGGTTIAGILALEQGGFNASVIEAVHAVTERGREMEAKSQKKVGN